MVQERDERKTGMAERGGEGPDEPAFGLLLSVIGAGVIWVIIAAVVVAFWR